LAVGGIFTQHPGRAGGPHPGPPPPATLEQVRAAVQAHAGDGIPFDDITLFAAQRAG
jgi:hypothetical protein